MGRGRDGGRLTKGPDAAARPGVQCRQRAGACRRRHRAPAARLLGLARHADRQRQRLFPVYAVDQPAVRPARGLGHAASRRPAACVRAARTPCACHAPGRGRMGAGIAKPGSGRTQPCVDRCADA
ncbi:hypothetical protein G6F68_018012 [Rhizopus microsporus]|nr:hypothetical protein G6F68_018012 [Rhizopus microsporus]